MSDIESADNEKGTKEPENKAVQVKREASVEFEHESPRAESSEPNRLPTGDDSLTDMLTDDSYDELLPTPSILPTYDSQNNSDLSTTESFPNVQGLLLSRSDLIGLAEHREGYRLLSLPFHVMSVSKDGDMEFTTRGPPRSLIPDWEIRASAGNKLCSVDQWEDGRSSSVYFAYSSAAYPIARLQMQGNDRAPTLDHIQANPHRHAIVDRVCALPSSPSSVRFVTSANDGTCFHWSAESPSSEPTVERLNIYTSAPLNDLSFCSETSSLYLCGNDGTVSKFDMHSATSSTVLSLDAAPRHLHVHSSNVILLETDDPDLEFEIRDLRTPRSSCRFGYDRRSHLSFEGRGDLQSGLFARGDAKGTVRLWDLRNVEDHFSYTVARGRQVPHVIFNSITRDRVQLISCLADNRLSFSTLVATP
ncbi:uncharacterized protein EI90DRAFT_703169 [Cantharellus anzutake]|uniref:uncharacterized protein n=1 Tax=Cantharellus anzutake TaxID=1750568 RepID=UPI001904C382|nr:uncharacterized protein EI90DRAFT_703169 [Cantharellus anzutake]KAF8332774.1 hypothetical protein EI90DRAFT_703169 [Cantharellus anzutake]